VLFKKKIQVSGSSKGTPWGEERKGEGCGFRVQRVLIEDGTLWLNIGDCYTSGNRGYRAPDKKNPVMAKSYRVKTPAGLKPKDLVGIPWRLAFALQQAGWNLRSDIIVTRIFP
jgi:hypothetical protein